MRRAALIAVVLLAPLTLRAQPPSDATRPRDAARAWRTAHEASILREFSALLAMPNVASNVADIRRNADTLVAMLQRRGATAQVITAADGYPAVFGELKAPGATRTIALYAHFDGQPVDPSQWTTPPFSPTLRNKSLLDGGQPIPFPTSDAGPPTDRKARIYARSASDDKGSIITMLTALDALKAGGVRPSVNVKFFFDGEEEAGSPHLKDILQRHKGLLTADAWLFCDGPLYQNGRNQLLFGDRGVTGLELIVYGPSRPLHSGHYGNWAPNPAVMMSTIIASMRNDDGRILIKKYYDDVVPVSAIERKAIAGLPNIDSTLRTSLALGRTEGGGVRLAELIMRPALNVRGISVGATGDKATNAISSEARASFDFRLVPRQTPERVRALVEGHLKALGYFVTTDSVTTDVKLAHARVAHVRWETGYPATRVSLDWPFSKALLKALGDGADQPPLAVPAIGGSGPTWVFEEVLGAPMLTLPIANFDNSQHSANENISVDAIWNGIELYAALIGRVGAYWQNKPVP